MNPRNNLLRGCLFVGFVFSLLLANPAITSGQTSQQFINTGEEALFSETVTGILSAHNTFQTAYGAYPNDPVINAYLALTRLLDLALREDSTGSTALLARYGVLRYGTDVGTLEFNPTVREDDYLIIPETAPSGETIRSFAAGTVLNAIDASILNLDKTISIWNNLSKQLVSKTKTGDSLDLEWDYGDIYLFRAFLKAAKGLVLTATAYDTDIDIREVAALLNIEALHIGKLLERYQNFLKLLSVTSTPSVNGAAQLTTARTTLISAIDDYLLASDKIRNDPGTNVGAEELFAIEPYDLLEEELLRERLTGLRTSLVNGTPFPFTEREERWTFTDGVPPGRQLDVKLIDNRSDGQFWGLNGVDFISGGGGIEGGVINGNQITLRLVSSGYYWADVSFSGTLNTARTQITTGSYSGWSWKGSVSGTFTGIQTDVDEEVTRINLNPLFGNGSGPYHVRDFMPDFDCIGEPAYGTMGLGLNPSNPDATLGGILPDFTQDDWDLDYRPSGEISIPVVLNGAIQVQDGSLSDWGAIQPVFIDQTGDDDPDLQGSDVHYLYLAKDDTYLYLRMTLADGPPNTIRDSDDRKMNYLVRFRLSPQIISGRECIVSYASNAWNLLVSDERHIEYYRSHGQDAQAVGNDLEWRVPLSAIGVTSGRYLETRVRWTNGSSSDPDSDQDNTCLRIQPTTSVTVNLTVPDYDGTGPIILTVYRDDGGFNPLEKNRIGDFVFIYPGEYPPGGMQVVIDGLAPGEKIWVSARWDADFTGILTKGDYAGSAGPVTIAADGSTVVNLTPRSMYVGDQESPYFRHCNVMAFKTQDGIRTAFQAEVYDPDGTVPGTISELRVIYPNGTTTYGFVPADYAGANIYSYQGDLGQQPPVGEYTFTVTDTEGRTAVSHFYFGGGSDLPIPDSTTLQASGNVSAATLSWGAVTGYQGNVFYRARIFDKEDRNFWTSGLAPGTSASIPSNILQQLYQDPGPWRWRVEAFDNHTYNTSYHRSVGSKVDIVPDGSRPYFENALVYHRRDSAGSSWTQAEVFVRDPDDTDLSSIQSIDVYNPAGDLLCSLYNADPQRRFTYFPAFNVFVATFPGSPAPGVYRFVVRDSQDNTKTTYDYVGPSFSIPLVDASTHQAFGEALAPMLSWAAPAGMDRPLYYQVIIENEGVRAWASNTITDTAVQVPTATLQQGISYTWYVRTQDNQRYGHHSNQGRAESRNLEVNPSPNPYFRWAGVHRRHDADGSFTGLSAAVIDPAGTLPGSITSLSVTTPLGAVHKLVDNGIRQTDVSYDSSSGEFFYRAPGAFQPGLYTFTLVKGGFTLVSYDWVGDTAEMPLADPMSITVSGNPAAPTVSWSGVPGFSGNVYYRLRVNDIAGNLVYSTSRDPVTAQTIPMGKLAVGKIYQARVEAQEHPDWVTYNSRSNTAYVWWSTEGGTISGVSGQVRDDLGNPIANLNVSANAGSCQGSYLAGTNTDQNGNYTLYLPPGPVVIRACATCSNLKYVDEWYNNVYHCNDANPIFLVNGQVTQGINFILDRAGVISGYAYEDDSQTPIPNLHVYTHVYGGTTWVAGDWTDAAGHYSLNVPSGTYIVRACPSCTGMPYEDQWYDDPNTPSSPEPVSVTAPGEVSGINFALALLPTPGDINKDGVVTLADAIVGLQLVAGMNPSNINNSAHVNLDGQLGLAEVIYILQKVAELR